MRLRYRIPLALITIFMILTLFIASSYALWKVTVYQETENIIETGCFSIQFEESSSINLNNTYPMSDESGMKLSPYSFTIRNTCTVDAKYTVYLNTLEVNGEKLADDFIKYSLIKTEDALNTAYSLDTAKVNLDKTHFSFDKNILKSYEIATGTLKGKTNETNEDGESVTYDLRLWIDEKGTNSIGGQTFEAGVSTIAYATKLTENSSAENLD